MTDRNRFAADYIEAALFADTPEEAPGAQLSAEAEETLRAQAFAFYDAHSAEIETYEAETDSNASHDLWYTARSHGCGYWEHDTEAARGLDHAAKIMGGATDIYLGDDGELHVA